MTAPSHVAPCAVCGWAMLTGQRVGRLADGTARWIHVFCTGTASA